jgi:hypothetical protein
MSDPKRDLNTIDTDLRASSKGVVIYLEGHTDEQLLWALLGVPAPVSKLDGSQAANMQPRDLELRYQCLIAHDLSVFEAFYKERSTTTAQGCCGRRLTSTCALPPRFVCNTILCVP